ncbi:MAG: hypothetical protein V4675_19435 [Verrucomicrobiota bacterium]
MVYLVLRSEYQEPHGRKILEFPDAPDLVAWLRTYWVTRQDLITINPAIAREQDFDPRDWQDEIHTLRKSILGGAPNGFTTFFVRMVDHPRPENMDDVRKFIASFDREYGEGSIEINGTAIQAHTNNDEIDLAWYLFDQAYADQNPGRTSFILHKPFELPATSGTNGWRPPVDVHTLGSGKGTTFCCFASSLDGATLQEIDGCYGLPGRLPDLGKWLAGQKPGLETNDGKAMEEWHENLILLRAFSLTTEEQDHTFEGALRRFDETNRTIEGWLPAIFSNYRYEIKKPALLLAEKTACGRDLQEFLEADAKARENARRSYWEHSSGESLFQFTPHCCQVVFTKVSTARDSGKSHKNIQHWIFFDDLWAEANKELSESILHYGRGENLLGK